MNYFNDFKQYAFRVETLQKYDVESEQTSFDNFLKHGVIDDNFNNDWHDIIKQAKQRGANMSRVHIIQLPLTDYLRFELEAYKLNEKYGEEVFIIADNENKQPIKDFWLFDDEVVLEMNYSADGKYIGRQERRDNLDNFIKIKNDLLAKAIPLKDFNLK